MGRGFFALRAYAWVRHDERKVKENIMLQEPMITTYETVELTTTTVFTSNQSGD